MLTLLLTITAVIGASYGVVTLLTPAAYLQMLGLDPNPSAILQTRYFGAAVLGAGLMQAFSQFFYQWFGARWPLMFGVVFILLVMFLPYGIVGTWQMRRYDLQAGWRRLFQPLRGESGVKEKL